MNLLFFSFFLQLFLFQEKENSSIYLSEKSVKDTIPFWHIYLNKHKIQEFSQTSKNKVLELNYSQSDTLFIHYYSDVYCFSCHRNALIRDSKKNILLQLPVNHQNYFKRYYLPLKLLFVRKEETFDFFLTTSPLQEKYLFSIKLK